MAKRFIVLDDDPTGTQAVRDVPVFLRWPSDDVRESLGTHPAVHLLTNARAMTAADAEAVTFDAARAAAEACPDARIVLRGDSTLRGHLLPEYRAVTRAAYPDHPPVLMLVPALPAAGRVTRAGIHYAGSVPVHETAYARDGVFSYRSSHLLEWAQERTDGLLNAERGIEVPLETLRARGPSAVLAAIADAARDGAAAVVVPDAETTGDIDAIAAGARMAFAADLPLLVRAAPAFAAALTGTAANGFVTAPNGRDGLLIVCGSYVERSTEQLARLYEARGIAPVELNLETLLGHDGAGREIARAAQLADERIAADGLAVVTTPRERPAGMRSLEAGMTIAHGLAGVLPRMASMPGVILAKGGITSHVTLASGVGCDRALVLGPIATGVARWRVSVGERHLDYLVFPGNVGDEDHLSDVVSLIMDD